MFMSFVLLLFGTRCRVQFDGDLVQSGPNRTPWACISKHNGECGPGSNRNRRPIAEMTTGAPRDLDRPTEPTNNQASCRKLEQTARGARFDHDHAKTTPNRASWTNLMNGNKNAHNTTWTDQRSQRVASLVSCRKLTQTARNARFDHDHAKTTANRATWTNLINGNKDAHNTTWTDRRSHRVTSLVSCRKLTQTARGARLDHDHARTTPNRASWTNEFDQWKQGDSFF